MKNCESYQEMISRMLDGDLSKEERAELAEHVKRCPDCAAVYVAFRSLSENLGGELEEPPAAIRENVMAEVRRGALKKRNKAAAASHRRWHAVLTAAACLVLIVAAGMSLPRILSRNRSAAAPAPAEIPMLTESYTAEKETDSTIYYYANNDARADAVIEAPAAVAEPESSVSYGSTGSVTAAEEEAGGTLKANTVKTMTREELFALVSSEDQPLALTEAQSEALIEHITYEKLPLDGAPELELYLLYWLDGVQKPLTVFVLGSEALYVYNDGDSFCRITGGAQTLQDILSMAGAEK